MHPRPAWPVGHFVGPTINAWTKPLPAGLPKASMGQTEVKKGSWASLLPCSFFVVEFVLAMTATSTRPHAAPFVAPSSGIHILGSTQGRSIEIQSIRGCSVAPAGWPGAAAGARPPALAHVHTTTTADIHIHMRLACALFGRAPHGPCQPIRPQAHAIRIPPNTPMKTGRPRRCSWARSIDRGASTSPAVRSLRPSTYYRRRRVRLG